MTKTIQTIVPHLWYDIEAKEAGQFYISIFPDSKITNITTLNNTPSGDSHLVSFELWGQSFMAISAVLISNSIHRSLSSYPLTDHEI